MGRPELSDRLFVPSERWGWEYVDPGPLVPSPEAARPPVWAEPPKPPEVAKLEQRLADAKAKQTMVFRRASPMLGCMVTLVVVSVILAIATGSGVTTPTPGEVTTLVVLCFVLAGAIALRIGLPRYQMRQVLDRAQRDRDALHAGYLAARRDWQRRIDEHDKAERVRHTRATLWYPLALPSMPRRVDVIGGNGDGWASLLATLGSSLLATGTSLLLLDFTEQQVGGGLAAYAEQRAYPVTTVDLPAQWARWNVLHDLAAAETADLLADAVHSARPAQASEDVRTLDVDLLTVLLDRLDRPWTFRRMAAGMQVLRRIHDGTGLLTGAEIALLSSAVDLIGHTDRVQQELQVLTGTIDLLAQSEPADDPPGGVATPWPDRGMTVVTTAGNHRRRKEMLDRMVFGRVRHDLRARPPAADDTVLVVAGADHLGRADLEDLARQAYRADTRLVLMLERLRGDAHELLGGGQDAAAIVMRLGNAKEAMGAAEFIGRQHRFVLNQLTAQVGRTFTEGTSTSHGGQESHAESESTSAGASLSAGSIGDIPFPMVSSTFSSSTSVTETRARTWQDTVNQSTATSTNSGSTVSRVYEFTVEPTAVQALPPTAFVLVEAGHNGRRVVLGDCNPGICLLDRVADRPRQP